MTAHRKVLKRRPAPPGSGQSPLAGLTGVCRQLLRQSSSAFNRCLLISTITVIIVNCFPIAASLSGFSPRSLLPRDDIHFEVVEPETIRYTFKARPAQTFGTEFRRTYFHISLVVVEPNNACTELQSKLELANNIGLIERGGCSFLTKCIEAERSGMMGIVIYDNDYKNDELYIDMVDDDTKRNCSIPALFLLGKDGHMIRRSLDTHRINRAIINIPINISQTNRKQSPWVLW